MVKKYQCAYTIVKNQSFLSTFTETGSDGTILNPLTFQYGTNTGSPDVTVSPQYSGFYENNTFTGDLAGNGYQDIISVDTYTDNNNFIHSRSYKVIDINKSSTNPIDTFNLNDGLNTSIRVAHGYGLGLFINMGIKVL